MQNYSLALPSRALTTLVWGSAQAGSAPDLRGFLLSFPVVVAPPVVAPRVACPYGYHLGPYGRCLPY